MTKEFFGNTKNDQKIYTFCLTSKQGSEAHVLNYGATIQKLIVSLPHKKPVDIVLGFDNLEQYELEHPFFGSIIGRYANRIANSEIDIHGKSIQLSKNEGENHLHGGFEGFGKKVFEIKIEGEKLILGYLSKDGEEGYPGNLQVTATFEWQEDTFVINHKATTDQTTVVNLTRHEYFNLAQSDNIRGHHLQINADAYLPKKVGHLPTGEVTPVVNSVMDLRASSLLGSKLEHLEGGFDHNYVLNVDRGSAPAAILSTPESGIKMSLFCTQPGLQFYSAPAMELWEGKHGAIGRKSPALCLEPQDFPDAPHHAHFPNTLLEPNETYAHEIKYQFEAL